MDNQQQQRMGELGVQLRKYMGEMQNTGAFIIIHTRRSLLHARAFEL